MDAVDRATGARRSLSDGLGRGPMPSDSSGALVIDEERRVDYFIYRDRIAIGMLDLTSGLRVLLSKTAERAAP